MHHLTEPEFIDLIEGTLDASRAAHASACRECATQVETLRSTLGTLTDEPSDEPSPLLWTTLPGRVAAAIDSEPRTSWWMRWPALTALGSAAALLIVLGATLWRPSTAPNESSSALVVSVAPGTSAPVSPAAQQDDDPELDAAWAVVRTAAVDLDYDAALEAGISPSPGAAETAAMQLSVAERAELARLIEEEIKRRGA